MHKKKHNERRPAPGLLAPLCACLWLLSPVGRAEDTSLRLATELASEGDHAGAAVEFRRLALAAPGAPEQGAYYWAAAYENWKAGSCETADKMLDRVEDLAPDLGSPALILRGEASYSKKRWKESAFYFQTAAGEGGADDLAAYAARRAAGAELQMKDVEAAREALKRAPKPQDAGLAALDRYAGGRDKSPRLGGLLGMVPGLGYAYAGEYATALRSLILNGLFIFGMVETADDEQWGGFAVITFFEFTWYSGSIYGGIDASHRYNQDRLDRAVHDVNGNANFAPEYVKLPVLSLQFTF